MAQGNGHGQAGRNKYDKPNKYESERKHAGTSAPPAVAPAVITKPAIDQFQPRNLPTPALYNPTLGGRRRDQRQAQEHIRALQTANQIAGAAAVLVEGLTKFEETHQRHELVQLRRGQLPAKIEHENLSLGGELLQARTEFEAKVEKQQDERVDRERIRELEREDFETLRADRRAARLEAQARALAAEQNLARASETGQRKAEAAFHKAAEEAFEAAADAESQRRRRDQERHKRGQAADDQTDDMPADVRAPLRVVRTVAKTREWAEREEARIRAPFEAAGQPLSREATEEIDQIWDAIQEAESSIRRRGASDL